MPVMVCAQYVRYPQYSTVYLGMLVGIYAALSIRDLYGRN